jgi:ATP-dependent Clp protease protease subunit
MSDSEKNKKNQEIWVNDFTETSAQNFREDILKIAKSSVEAPIIIRIDSYGGSVDALSKMIATMNEVPNTKITVAMGKAMSAGAILLSHGDIRYCDKDARVMVHEVSSWTGGDVHDIYADATEIKRLNKHFMRLLAKNCGMKGGYTSLRKFIKRQDGRNIYMSASEALKFGIVDYIGTPTLITLAMYHVSHTQTRPRRSIKKSRPKKSKSKKITKNAPRINSKK